MQVILQADQRPKQCHKDAILIHGQVSLNSLYWKKNLQTDICGPRKINEKTAYIQARSFMARTLEDRLGKKHQAEGEAKSGHMKNLISITHENCCVVCCVCWVCVLGVVQIFVDFRGCDPDFFIVCVIQIFVCLLVEFWWCLKRLGAQLCTFGVLWLSYETPTAPKPPGFHTTTSEPERGHLRVLVFKNHQNSTKRPPEREERVKFPTGEGKKSAKF